MPPNRADAPDVLDAPKALKALRQRKALGQRVRQLRAKKGYSQEAFADSMGVHRTFVGTIERGESNLSFLNLVKISQAL
jgi:DNA-binding XRE family transcriptional regulator